MIYLFIALAVIWLICSFIGWILERIGDLFGWLWRHKPVAVGVGGFFLLSFLFGAPTALPFTILYAVGYLLVRKIMEWAARLAEKLRQWARERNELMLRRCLEADCLKLGHMTPDLWRARLPAYVDLEYPEPYDFDEIVRGFAQMVEENYIDGDEQLAWLEPIVHDLVHRGMADVGQLSQVSSEGLTYTHNTPDAKLIYDALEKLRAVKKVGGKAMIEKISLTDREQVRRDLKIPSHESVPSYYMAAYKISDALMDRRRCGSVSYIEREELVFSDL